MATSRPISPRSKPPSMKIPRSSRFSHVVFKSGYLYDMQRITELAHRKGALVLWDLSHSVGSVPVHLDDCNADFAIGCTYKYLNGGPARPHFSMSTKIFKKNSPRPSGVGGTKNPFDFGLEYKPAPGAKRFLVGTQPMISLLTMEAALEPILCKQAWTRSAKIHSDDRLCLFLTESLLASHSAFPRLPA